MQPKTSPYTFRLNNISDEVLINMINSANSKTEFIKNALFYYFINISKGNVHDRELPVGWGLDKGLLPLLNLNQLIDNNRQHNEDDSMQQGYEPPDDTDEDDYDDYDDEEYDDDYDYDDYDENVDTDIEI